MTGLGAYCYIVWGIWLRHCLNGRQDEYQLVWPHLFSPAGDCTLQTTTDGQQWLDTKRLRQEAKHDQIETSVTYKLDSSSRYFSRS
jgi:hypothetical protein